MVDSVVGACSHSEHRQQGIERINRTDGHREEGEAKGLNLNGIAGIGNRSHEAEFIVCVFPTCVTNIVRTFQPSTAITRYHLHLLDHSNWPDLSELVGVQIDSGGCRVAQL